MSQETGNLIKKARTAAGMTQADLAKSLDGVTATDISKAERGLIELEPDQLKAIAKAVGAEPATLLPQAAPEAPAQPAAPAIDEGELLDLYRKADPATQAVVVALLKGEKPYLPIASALFAKLMGALTKDPASPMTGFVNNVRGLVTGENPGADNPLEGILTGIMSIAGSVKTLSAGFKRYKAEKAAAAPAKAEEAKDAPADQKAAKARIPANAKQISQPLLAFTFFYAVAIYILQLSFYFWLWRTDIKPEK